MNQQQTREKPGEQVLPVEPGHVMAREQYERLVREVQQQK